MWGGLLSKCTGWNVCMEREESLCRDKYQVSELVGGRRGYCKLAGRTIVREDIVLVCSPSHICRLICT